uniref:Leucine-rich repeat-containing N-terminal plant-type domain-containing protein n=1 Tax=Setaria digitata TaxID=48799 RepID=A0A915Q0K3_9BILA
MVMYSFHSHCYFRQLLLLAIFHFLNTFSFSLAQCPPLQPPCRCSPSIHEPVAIICENASSLSDIFTAIAEARSVTIAVLHITDTVIPSLPAFILQDFTISRLVLNRCNLNHIDDNAFAGSSLDKLVDLDLSDNQLGAIPTTGVPRLRNLRKLYLNRNRISHLYPNSFTNYDSRDTLQKLELAGNRLSDQAFDDSSVFRPLRSLQQLSLETNALSSIPSASLVNQRQTLINLNLGLNRISEVPVGALNFPNLISLSLEFNGISQIIPQAFQGTPNLQYLYLTGNKFPSWQPEMFTFVPHLLTLGIGETPIAVIPSNAFQYISKLIRLEMSEAAVDTIERGAFQRTPNIQAIILNKNRLSVIRSDYFKGLDHLYSVNLGGNRIDTSEPFAFANLPQMNHLDISFNQLQELPDDTFTNSFLPDPHERRIMYVCGNPWLCNSALEWFRTFLRENVDIDVDKPGCIAACVDNVNDCPPVGTPLRAVDNCPASDIPLPLTRNPLALVGWIILAIIMTILLISICLMALVRYGISHRRKKMKEQEALEDEQRIMSITGSGVPSVITRSYLSPPTVDLDLPPARNLDETSANYLY